jgi:hypothetical protein
VKRNIEELVPICLFKSKAEKSNSRDRFLFIYPEQASTEKTVKMCIPLSWVFELEKRKKIG